MSPRGCLEPLRLYWALAAMLNLRGWVEPLRLWWDFVAVISLGGWVEPWWIHCITWRLSAWMMEVNYCLSKCELASRWKGVARACSWSNVERSVVSDLIGIRSKTMCSVWSWICSQQQCGQCSGELKFEAVYPHQWMAWPCVEHLHASFFLHGYCISVMVITCAYIFI